MLKLKPVGIEEISRNLDRAIVKFPDNNARLMRRSTHLVKRRSTHYLTGSPTFQSGTRAPNEGLASQSGTLLESIKESVRRLSGGVEGRVYDESEHGKYWELDKYFNGGVRVIRPVKAKALHFVINGRDVFAQKVIQKGPRKFLSPALRDELPGITKLYADANAELIIRGRADEIN